MQIVIDIGEELYKDIQSRDWKNGDRWYSDEWKAIHNGTPLPKGHGNLIDADELLKDRHRAIPVIEVIEALTILEADKAGSEVNE